MGKLSFLHPFFCTLFFLFTVVLTAGMQYIWELHGHESFPTQSSLHGWHSV